MAATLTDIFKCIFLAENDTIPIQISLKFLPRSPIDNKPALVQVMAWRRIGDKPFRESMMTPFTDPYMWHYGEDGLTLYVLFFFRGNINIYLHFVSFLHIDTTQVVEILPQIRQESTYST